MARKNGMLGIVVLIVGIIIFLSFGIQAMGVIDGATNMTGTAYEEQYNTSTEVFTGTVSVMQYLPLILVIGAIIGGLLFVAGRGRW